jgi:hypothetical protein
MSTFDLTLRGPEVGSLAAALAPGAVVISADDGPDLKREIWKACRVRSFDLGVRGETKPTEVSVSQESIALVASVGGALGIAVYPPTEAE